MQKLTDKEVADRCAPLSTAELMDHEYALPACVDKVAGHYTVKNQVLKLAEECSELAAACHHLAASMKEGDKKWEFPDNDRLAEFVSEAADVIFLLKQWNLLGLTDDDGETHMIKNWLARELSYKATRQVRRIDEQEWERKHGQVHGMDV